MNPEDEKKLKKIATFADNPRLALLNELEMINEHLEAIHKMMESMNEKEMPMHDFSKIEELLEKILDKKEDIEVTLEIL